MSTREAIFASALAVLLGSSGTAWAQPQCTTVTISPSATRTGPVGPLFFRAGGTGFVYVTSSTPDCTWTVSSNAAWVTLPDGATGAGTRYLRFAVDPMSPPSADRIATITVTATNNAPMFAIVQSPRLSLDEKGSMQSPVGWKDSPSTATIAQPFKITGFAIDDRATSGTGVSSVDVFWTDNTGAGGSLGSATYGLNRPHLAETAGSQFADGGFEMLVSGIPAGTTVPAGASVSITVYGHSTVDGTLLGAAATRITVVDPALTVSPASVQFGAASSNGVVSAVTPAQSVKVVGFGWTTAWTASSGQPWIQLSAASGTGPGLFDVSIDPAQVPASGVLLGTIHVDAAGVPGAPIDIPVRVDAYFASRTAAPFGSFDSAPSPSANAVPLTGWALDDVGVTGVQIYRSASRFETGTSLVFIGDATFVEGARPDVAATFPNTPQKTRGGWGYMLLSNVLPGGGNETLTFYAFARDAEGRQTLIGAKPVRLQNSSTEQPFGALDLPAPGETVSGVRTFAGWALSPRPGQILDIRIVMDGQAIGTARYGSARPDVAALFGGPSGPIDASAPGFQFTIDTRGFTNGLHTIAFVARDNKNTAAGLGSRFFIVRNP